MTEAIKNNNHNKALLDLCGITYGETWISFNPKKITVSASALTIHLEALHLALQATLPDHKVELVSEENTHYIMVNNTVVMAYKPHWFTREMQYKRTHGLRLSINTVAHGDFIGGLVDIFFNGIFGKPAGKVDSVHATTVVH